MTVNYLDEIAEALLDAGEAALIQSTTGHEAPDHTFLSHGPPTGDHCCDGGELAVWLETIVPQDLGLSSGSAVAGSIAQKCAVIWEATYVISLHRCYPVGDQQGNAPSPAAWHTAASDLLVDLWAILTELTDRLAACTLIPNVNDCAGITFGISQIAEGGPTGACAGWEIRVSTRCNDPGPLGS